CARYVSGSRYFDYW
nr:immunoglobulin heavy chain junction region [Macaca mulatta]